MKQALTLSVERERYPIRHKTHYLLMRIHLILDLLYMYVCVRSHWQISDVLSSQNFISARTLPARRARGNF